MIVKSIACQAFGEWYVSPFSGRMNPVQCMLADFDEYIPYLFQKAGFIDVAIGGLLPLYRQYGTRFIKKLMADHLSFEMSVDAEYTISEHQPDQVKGSRLQYRKLVEICNGLLHLVVQARHHTRKLKHLETACSGLII